MNDERGESAPIEILLVEDSSDDVLLIRAALEEGKVANRLHVVQDGDTAMEFMHGRTPNPGGVIPDLVLLDLNLPGKDGREVLAEIKGNPQLRMTPVIVMTTSAEERDILAAYDLAVNAYVQKPLHLDDFITAIGMIEDFWLTIVRLPRRPDRRA